MAPPITRSLDKPPSFGRPLLCLKPLVADLSPGAFAFVMATGIVAHDARLAAMSIVGHVLLWIALVSYVGLFVLTLARLVCFPERVLAELASQQRGPGYLALVAATGVVGAELAPINLQVATAFWLLESMLWLTLAYAFFADDAARERKPQAKRALSGSLLLAVVATQSVALLGTLVASVFGAGEGLVLFISLSMFFSGCVLYLALIPLIVYRLEFLSLAPIDFTPDYWINMGAMAITTLTGSMLIAASEHWLFLQQLVPFLLGLGLFFWAGATWWIPLLILLQVWRHLLKHVRLVYGIEYWSMVFPVGMYAACTFAIAALVHLGPLVVLAQSVAYVALALWLIAFMGLARHVVRAISGPIEARRRTLRARANQRLV
jgi:tellurite resistance protein TehA-like permease